MFIENLNHNCEKSMWILDQKCSEVKGALRRRRRCLSRPPTFGGWRHGEGCLLPAAQKSDRRTFSTISRNSWDLPIHLLRGFGIFPMNFFWESAPPSRAWLDSRHCIWCGVPARLGVFLAHYLNVKFPNLELCGKIKSKIQCRLVTTCLIPWVYTRKG